jgi:hypothetical protein
MNALKRIVLKLIKILIGIELAWLVIGNVMLNTGIGPWVASIKPDKFTMDWDSGWTPYPAKLSVNNVTMKIHTWSTDVELKTDTAEAQIRLSALFEKRLLIDNLVVGKSTIAIYREVPEGEKPAPAKPYPGLTIEIRNAEVASVEEFIFNKLSVSGGETHASGSASMQIRGDKIIENVDVSWTGANLQIADKKFTETLNASFKGGMEAFNPRIDKGLALIEKLSGQITLNGRVGTLSPLKLFFLDADWVEKIDGEGNVAIDALISQGKLQQGTVVDIDAEGLEVDFLGFKASGSGRVDGRVDGVGNSRIGQLNILFDSFELGRKGMEVPLVQGKGLSLKTQAPNMGLTDSISDLEITLDVPDSHFPDIAVLQEYLPPALGVAITDGSASLQGSLKVAGPDKLATGSLTAKGNDIAGSFRSTGFKMDFSLDSEVSGEKLDDFVMSLSGTKFRLFNGIFDNEDVEVDKRWWMEIDVPTGTINLAEPVAIEADVDLAMKDTRAVIALFSEISEWISRFDGLLTVNDVVGHASVQASEKQLRVRDLTIQGDRLDMVAELDANDGENNAIVWGKLGILSVGFERIGEETDWKLINGREWFDENKQESWIEK